MLLPIDATKAMRHTESIVREKRHALGYFSGRSVARFGAEASAEDKVAIIGDVYVSK